MAEKQKKFDIERSIFLFDDVHQGSSENVVSKIIELAAKSEDDIFLFINSWGGEVSSMNAILDAMGGVKNEIHTIVLGEADSSAAVISSSGTKGKRKIGSRSKVMIHEVSAFTMGTTSEIEKSLEKFKETSNILFDQLAKNTGKTREYIEDLVKGKDYWMDSVAAVDFGMADESISDEKEDLLEFFFDTTTNSAGETRINIGDIDLDKYKMISKNIDTMINMKNKEDNSTTINKEIPMEDNKSVITPEQVATLVKRVDEVTNQLTEANKAKADAEQKLNAMSSSIDVTMAELNSKIKVLEEEKIANDKRARETALNTFKEVATKAIPKELLDEVVGMIDVTKADVALINKLTEAVNKVQPLVPVVTIPDSETKTFIPSNSKAELDVMTPHRN